MSAQSGTEHYTLDELGDGVYAAIAKQGGAAIGNAGLVDLGDATLVIDTFLTPTAAEHLLADARRLTDHAPRWVLNTHYHNDHIWGNQVFVPEAQLISTVETRALIETAGKEEYGDYRAIADDRLAKVLAQQAAAATEEQRKDAELFVGYFRGLVQDFPRLKVMLPNLTFEERLVLHGSQRRVELIEFHGAHTGSDTVVWLPDEHILFMSDLLFVRFHPYIGDGNPERVLEVLRSLVDGTAGIEGVQRYVPGHGPAGTAGDLQVLADYVREMQRMAGELAARGAAQADAASAPIPTAYAGWGLPRFFHANLNFLLKSYSPAQTEEADGRNLRFS